MTCWYHTTPSKLCDKCMDDERRKAAAMSALPKCQCQRCSTGLPHFPPGVPHNLDFSGAKSFVEALCGFAARLADEGCWWADKVACLRAEGVARAVRAQDDVEQIRATGRTLLGECAVRDEVAAKRHNLNAKIYEEACLELAGLIRLMDEDVDV